MIDAFHRKVVGWSMSGRITEKLVADALERRSEGRARPRASASSSTMTRVPSTLPGRSGAASSPMGSPDPCRGRATHGTTRSRKSFFKMLKRELVNGKGCKTREEAKRDVLKYIELYYDTRRMRSSIGYNAPCDLERDAA